ncbi:hypothetical protein AB2B41_17225 [Marimonas sp. MJW-29]|uniref:Uncharacterized protein n=1 Tax=Sulfitobacter sediminis TaxID=3234186 RepID=A0ABV3RQT0_9RHOB
MGYPTKIATCCYCGSRSALKLDRQRHELACASCGAPLSVLKMMPASRPSPEPAVSHHPSPRRFPNKPTARLSSKPRRRKDRKNWLKEIAEEVFDLVEDIFD